MIQSKETNLGKDRVGRLFFALAVPAITSQVVNALYNMVDRMYIGHIEGTGDLALTGLGVAFPVIMFISALSALAGMGGGSKAAIRMGAGDQEGANAILGGCTALLVVISLVVTVLFQVFKDPMLLLFGASENTLGYASDYLGIYLWGTIAVQFSLGLNNFITTQGFSTVSMLTVIIGAITNIASAILLKPEICENIVVVWLGGHARHMPITDEFNMKQDIAAARVVMQSGVPFVQLPCAGVVNAFSVSGPELRLWLSNKNPLADYLAENTIKAAERYAAGKPWTRVIWDVTAIAWLLNDENRFLFSRLIPVALPTYDYLYSTDESDTLMRYVYFVNRDALFKDLVDKLTS